MNMPLIELTPAEVRRAGWDALIMIVAKAIILNCAKRYLRKKQSKILFRI
jgi:hypothetical protein